MSPEPDNMDPDLVEAIVQCQQVVPQQLLLLRAEQPLAQGQAGARDCRRVVLHIQLVGELVGGQLTHCQTKASERASEHASIYIRARERQRERERIRKQEIKKGENGEQRGADPLEEGSIAMKTCHPETQLFVSELAGRQMVCTN